MFLQHIFLLLCIGSTTIITANKILVTTGVSDDSEETEVWNLDTESVCENDLPDYPMKMSYATGGLIGGKPVVCGGLDDDFERSEQCYVLENNRWTFLAEMISKRSSSSSVVTPDGNSLFITGGRSPNEDPKIRLETTEFISIDGSVRAGPDMPEPRSGHCMVRFEENKSILVGGKVGSKTIDSTVIFDHKTGTYSEGPKLVTKRKNQGCAVFNSPQHNGRSVVVVGGQGTVAGSGGTGRGVNDVEAWDFTIPGTSFERLSGLPKRVSQRPWMITTPSNDGLILIYDKYILEYVCKFNADCEWEQKMEGFEVDRLNHVAIELTSDFECES